VSTSDANPYHIAANRDYYDYAASFDGTSGVGCGSLAARPPTCTTGVAYWATDQSCKDLSGMVGTNPAKPISGKLYKCVSTNKWSTAGDGITYTPFQYPHPLRGEGMAAPVLRIVSQVTE
jgi:hypothetical protein